MYYSKKNTYISNIKEKEMNKKSQYYINFIPPTIINFAHFSYLFYLTISHCAKFKF